MLRVQNERDTPRHTNPKTRMHVCLVYMMTFRATVQTTCNPRSLAAVTDRIRSCTWTSASTLVCLLACEISEDDTPLSFQSSLPYSLPRWHPVITHMTLSSVVSWCLHVSASQWCNTVGANTRLCFAGITSTKPRAAAGGVSRRFHRRPQVDKRWHVVPGPGNQHRE